MTAIQDVKETNATAESKTAAVTPPGRVEITVSEIIQKGRAPVKSRMKSFWYTIAFSLLFFASLPPVGWSWTAWFALVPLCLLILKPEFKPRAYWGIYGGGLLFSLAISQWMRLGDPLMYFAWLATALYIPSFFVAFVAASRVAVQRGRLPLVAVVPLAWAGVEYLRGTLFTGMPWFFLSHSQYHWIELIQISDLVGAYGVSALLAMVSAALALLIAKRASTHKESKTVNQTAFSQAAITLLIFSCVLGYGYWRRNHEPFTAGPRVALIQGNFVSSLQPTHRAEEILDTHEQLTAVSVMHRPDLVVWPESMFPYPLFVSDPMATDEELEQMAPQVPVEVWRDARVPNRLRELSERAKAGLLVGLTAHEVSEAGVRHFNSAQFVKPGQGVAQRYDKMHLVPFGEYLPLRDAIPFLSSITPIAADRGLTAGAAPKCIQYGDWSFAPLICFEDTVPHLVTRIVRDLDGREHARPVDCLVNLSNDGWFHGSAEHDLHLMISAFRAVETRTPVVRAANVGISAFIDGDGVIREPEVYFDADAESPEEAKAAMRDPDSGRFHRGFNGVFVDTVALDPRTSVYTQYGDLFAGGGASLVVLLLAFASVVRVRGWFRDGTDSTHKQ